MHDKTIAALVTALLVAVPAAAQTVDEVITRNLEAMGGVQKLKAVQSVRMTGRLAFFWAEASFTRELKRPDMWRMDVTIQSATSVGVYENVTSSYGFDGTRAWSVNASSRNPGPQLMSEAGVERLGSAEIDGPFVDYQAKGITAELLGKESVKGAEVYKIKLTRKDGRATAYYLDAKSYLVMREETRAPSPFRLGGDEIEIETTLGDYKNVGGLMFAHRIISGPKGDPEGQTTRTIKKIELNVPIDDSRFRMPK